MRGRIRNEQWALGGFVLGLVVGLVTGVVL